MSRRAVATLAVALLVPVSAQAQGVFDHLKCHKVRDPLKFEATTADLDALQAEYSDTGCKIRKRAKLFCAPVTKTNVVPPPPLPGISGAALDGDFVCYKVKCPTRPEDQEVSDQFGTRTLARLRTDLLCVPAVKGPSPTSTTSTTSTTVPAVCGNGTIEGLEWCDGDEFCSSSCTINRFACCAFDTSTSEVCGQDVPALTLFVNQFAVCESFGGTFQMGRVATGGPTCSEPPAAYPNAQTGGCVAPPELTSPASVCCQDTPTSCSDLTDTVDQGAITNFVWGCLYSHYPDAPVVAGTCGGGGQCVPAH